MCNKNNTGKYIMCLSLNLVTEFMTTNFCACYTKIFSVISIYIKITKMNYFEHCNKIFFYYK